MNWFQMSSSFDRYLSSALLSLMLVGLPLAAISFVSHSL